MSSENPASTPNSQSLAGPQAVPTNAGPSGSSTTARSGDTSVVPNAESGIPTSAAGVNEEVAWALLHSKLGLSHLGPPFDGRHSDAPFVELLKALGTPSLSDSAVPPSVLAIAPHLAKLTRAESLNDHLHKTWELHQAYSSDRAIESIINLMQCQSLQDPIPRSIWHKIA